MALHACSGAAGLNDVLRTFEVGLCLLFRERECGVGADRREIKWLFLVVSSTILDKVSPPNRGELECERGMIDTCRMDCCV